MLSNSPSNASFTLLFFPFLSRNGIKIHVFILYDLRNNSNLHFCIKPVIFNEFTISYLPLKNHGRDDRWFCIFKTLFQLLRQHTNIFRHKNRTFATRMSYQVHPFTWSEHHRIFRQQLSFLNNLFLNALILAP